MIKPPAQSSVHLLAQETVTILSFVPARGKMQEKSPIALGKVLSLGEGTRLFPFALGGVLYAQSAYCAIPSRKACSISRTRKTPMMCGSAIAVRRPEWTHGRQSVSFCWVRLLEHYSPELRASGKFGG